MSSDDREQRSKGSGEIASSEKSEGILLHDTISTLSTMIKDLEKQLSKMIEINDALENDVENERLKKTEVIRERDALKERLFQAEEDLASTEDLKVEIGHLERERARLASTIEGFGTQLAESEKENRKLERLTDRLHLERDDTLEELHSVETQFERAMEMVSDFKIRISTIAEERDALVSRLKVVESQLQQAENQRDSLKSEVEESRRALEEIRRSVADVCVTSQRIYYQQDQNE